MKYWQKEDQKLWDMLSKKSNEYMIKRLTSVCMDSSSPNVTINLQCMANILRKRMGLRYILPNAMSYNWFKTGGFPMDNVVRVKV